MHYFPLDHDHLVTEHEFQGCCGDCRRSLRMIKEHLFSFHRQISCLSRDDLRALTPAQLYQLYLVLDDIAHLDGGNHLPDMILADRAINRILPEIRQYYTTFFELHETALAREVVASPDPWTTLQLFGLYPRYEALIRSQVETLALPHCGKVVFIGCGPVPLSLFLMHRLYGIKSTGLDSDSRAVSLATECVHRLELSTAIEILHGDHNSLAELEWDLVLIAALAEPKREIFRKLAEIMPRGDKRPVICRTYSGLRGLLHQPLSATCYQDFHVTHEVRPGGRVNNTLLLLKRDHET